MNRVFLHRGALAVAATLIALPLPAAAQWTPPAPPAAQAPSTSPASQATPSSQAAPSPQAAADQRIHALLTELHITDAQKPQWNAFADAMRNNATGTDALFRERASTATTMSALDNMKSYAHIARVYADNTETLANAFAALYGVLSDQQKQTIDGLFREDAARVTSKQQNKG